VKIKQKKRKKKKNKFMACLQFQRENKKKIWHVRHLICRTKRYAEKVGKKVYVRHINWRTNQYFSTGGRPIICFGERVRKNKISRNFLRKR